MDSLSLGLGEGRGSDVLIEEMRKLMANPSEIKVRSCYTAIVLRCHTAHLCDVTAWWGHMKVICGDAAQGLS